MYICKEITIFSPRAGMLVICRLGAIRISKIVQMSKRIRRTCKCIQVTSRTHTYHVTTYTSRYFEDLRALRRCACEIQLTIFLRETNSSYLAVRIDLFERHEISKTRSLLFFFHLSLFPFLPRLFAKRLLPKYRMHEDWLFIGNLCAIPSTEGAAKLKVVK